MSYPERRPDQRTIDFLNAISDDVTAIKRAQDYLDALRATMTVVEKMRDQRIRSHRSLPGHLTVDQLADATGVNRHVVITATRTKKPRRKT